MKKVHTVPSLLVWILVAAVEGGCGWRKVNRGEEINFSWDTHILEVKTEEISGSFSNEHKKLEIYFRTEKTEWEILRIQDLNLTQDNVLYCDITFYKEKISGYSWIPPGELRWILKKFSLLGKILVTLAGAPTLEGNLPLPNEDKTESFKFGSGDTISLLYRVNSTSGEENCVKPVVKCFYVSPVASLYHSFGTPAISGGTPVVSQ
ncbi:hypothetical protein ACHWQZ_G002441 [Mnemiopsis leidyi]